MFYQKYRTIADKKKLIQAYFDVSYEAIKKFKNKLKKASDKKLAPKSHYNEYTCYDYQIIKLVVYTSPDNIKLQPLINDLEKQKIKYTIVQNIDDIKKELNYYQGKQ